MPSQKVSIIIPAYNPGAYLKVALDSLLAQTFSNWEALVVDDGSSEPLDWVGCVDRRIRVERQENLGLSAARNTGINLTTAPYVAFLDADDVWLPEKLERQVARLDQALDIKLLSTQFQIIDSRGRVTANGYEGHHDSFESLLQGNGICVSTVIVRRSLLDRIGLFDCGFDAVQDWDLWLRVARVGKIERLDMPLAHYRLHSGGMSNDWQRTLREGRRLLDRYDGPDARIGRSRATELAAYQAFDAARLALRNRNYRTLRRSLVFVATNRPLLLAKSLKRSLQR